MLFGAHCSGGIKKAIERAQEIGADALQLFVQSPRAWRFPDHDPADLAAFCDRRDEAGLGAVLVHSLYLVNLASPNEDFYGKSVETMRRTVETGCAIKADGVVLHVGSHQGAGFEAGMERVAPALEQVLDLCSDTTWLFFPPSRDLPAAEESNFLWRSFPPCDTFSSLLSRNTATFFWT